MTYDTLTRPTNWWRATAIVLLCVAIFAGIVINRDRATNRDLTTAISELEDKILLARDESIEIRASLERREAHDTESQRIGNELADVLESLADGDSEIALLIRELADQVRYDLGGNDPEGRSSGISRSP